MHHEANEELGGRTVSRKKCQKVTKKVRLKNPQPS